MEENLIAGPAPAEEAKGATTKKASKKVEAPKKQPAKAPKKAAAKPVKKKAAAKKAAKKTAAKPAKKNAAKEEVVVTETPQEPVAPPAPPVIQQNSLLASANPDMIINMAIAYREQVATAGNTIDKGLLYEQIYNPTTGVLKKLNDVRPGAGAKLADFDKVVLDIKTRVGALLTGFQPAPGSTFSAPEVNQAPPSNPTLPQPTHIEHTRFNHQKPAEVVVEKPLTPKEALAKKFGKLLAVLQDQRAKMVCHVNHVEDFCMLNSKDGYLFHFNRATETLHGSYFGGQEKIEEHFPLTKKP